MKLHGLNEIYVTQKRNQFYVLFFFNFANIVGRQTSGAAFELALNSGVKEPLLTQF